MRVARRIVHVLLIVMTLVVGATAAAVIVAETAWFKNWLRGYIVRQANQYLNGQISIERLGGNLFFGVELEDIAVSMDGSQVVAVKDLGLDYNAFELISKGMSVDQIRLNRPTIYLRRDGDSWSISRLVKKDEQEADRQGPAFPIALDNVGVSDASVVIEGPAGTSGVAVPQRFDNIDAKVSFKYEPVRYSLEITHVSFRGSSPSIGLNALSGGVSVKDDTLFVKHLAVRTEETSILLDGAVQHYLTTPMLNVKVSSDKLSLPEIARLVPSLAGVPLQPAFEVALDGPLDQLGVDLNVRSSAGQLTGQLVADVTAPGQSAKGQVSIRHLNLAPILKDAKQQSDLTADAQFDLQATQWSDLDSLRGAASVRAARLAVGPYSAERVAAHAKISGRRVAIDGRASAYGADARTTGTVHLPGDREPLSYDLRGTVRHVNARRLPASLNVPPADTDVNADYHARGTEPPAGSSGSRRPAARTLDAELQFQPSTAAGARIENGSRATVSMRGSDVHYSADAQVAQIDLQRVGHDFHIPSLDADRFKSTINGHVTAEGHGTTLKDMAATAHGTLSDSTIVGGRIPELSFDAALEDDTAKVYVDGTFADVDPAVASGRPAAAGSTAGWLDAVGTIRRVSNGVTPDSVEGSVRTTLEASTVGGLAIDWANLDADYVNQSADIRDLEIVGRDLNAEASGSVSLADGGQSHLVFHADTPSLQELGKLAAVAIAGTADVTGTVTGNRSALQIAGTLKSDGLAYGDNGALNASADYTAHVPDLDVARAEISAKTRATFVTLAGQNINEVTADTTYREQNVTFDVQARQPQRALNATGEVALHPDHQEVHVRNLGLDSAGQRWQLAPSSAAAVTYGTDRVAVDVLRLVSGSQEIAASGALGGPGDQLKVTVRDMDLAAVDAFLIRPPQLAGRLNATGTVSGSLQAPRVEADFDVAQGGFRQFHYDTLGGTASYGGSGVTVDARLQQNPSQWVAAKGYLPTALFSAGDSASRSAERIDFTVDSSPMDLGLIQGFTSELTKVTGSFEAHLHVGGTADSPEPSGALTVKNGTAHVEDTGVDYKNITGRIDVQPDRIHIDQITVLDNQNNALSLTGDLAVRERQLGGVELYVNSDDFKVVDNKVGNVRVQTSLQIQGDLQAPRVKGDIGVTTGRLDLDQVIALAGASPYATTQTEYGASRTAAPETAPQAVNPFEALTLDVGLYVPNDFVVKASNLRTPGAAIGLGALNVTIGGDLHASKTPRDVVRLRGIVNTVRGTYDFQGRRFDILREGTVQFEGLDQIDPSLDVRAQRIIQGVTALVNIRGTLSQPEIVLNSVPPLEQADILSLIVFNQPINQVSEGQQTSLMARAQSLATGAVTSGLAQSIGNALNLDTFEIDVAPENGGGPQVTLGQQLSQNLYVQVQQGIVDQGSTNFVLEYELARWLRLQTNVVQGASNEQALFRRAQSSGADLIFFFSY